MRTLIRKGCTHFGWTAVSVNLSYCNCMAFVDMEYTSIAVFKFNIIFWGYFWLWWSNNNYLCSGLYSRDIKIDVSMPNFETLLNFLMFELPMKAQSHTYFYVVMSLCRYFKKKKNDAEFKTIIHWRTAVWKLYPSLLP